MTPGSPDAVKAGCRCPVLDNNRGRGAYRDADGVSQFWMSGDCPLHGIPPPPPSTPESKP